MASRSVERVQDSVHGLMEFRGLEAVVVEVLRTPELQRLRRVRQLGMAHYVFPGAEHSRLTHSLGSAHLAIRFGNQLRVEAPKFFVPTLVLDESAIADFALAALCHDLGHGPLSHAWEREVIGEDFDRDQWSKTLGLDPGDPLIQNKKWHEVVGQGLLAWPEGQLHRLLESHEVGTALRIRQMLGGEYYLSYLPRLLSSDVDVDRADFIMRDAHYTGVAYGRFDLNWLISTCTFGRTSDPGDEWIVGFDERKSVRVIEQFLIARRALYDTVYHHKTVRCIEGMVALLLRRLRGVLEGDDALHGVSEFVEPMIDMMRGEALNPSKLMRVDDFYLAVLIDTIASGLVKDEISMDLARRIQARDLFRQIPVESKRIGEFLASPERREEVYEAIQPFVPGSSEFYIIVDHSETKMFSEPLSECSLLVNSAGRASAIRDHPSLIGYRNGQSAQWRIFTVRQAVENVTKVIKGRGGRRARTEKNWL
ncbi:MAG TPA: HD domain-containing protein [Thermoanaerobaculia bacterium]|nr:HD domain-containing protein [Thermoanaerobaculia bacterium]